MADLPELPRHEAHAVRPSLVRWLGERLPSAAVVYRHHLAGYFVPKNLNLWYVFGALALLVLGLQVLTGFFLLMHYKPDARLAFASLEHLMREVRGGALMRYMHSTGASAIFLVVYLHMFRGMLYGSYRKPRELVWLLGCGLFALLMAEAFMGGLLPWGQTSYWGAQVITNLIAAVPLLGPALAGVIRGGPAVGDATLSRFFALHVVGIPLLLGGLLALHLVALRDVGSGNPDGIELQKGPKGNRWSATAPADTVPFHPYYTVRDVWVAAIFLTGFFAVVFFAPEMGGYFLEYGNLSPANPLRTPAHIAPMWYFAPFYAMLRSMTRSMASLVGLLIFACAIGACISSKTGPGWRKRAMVLAVALLLALLAGTPSGVLHALHAPALLHGLDTAAGLFQGVPVWGALWSALCSGMGVQWLGLLTLAAAVLIFCALPWLDRSPVLSIRYRPRWHRMVYAAWGIVFVGLGVLGRLEPDRWTAMLEPMGTLLYFAFFLLMPWWSRRGRCAPVPDRLVYRPRRPARKGRA